MSEKTCSKCQVSKPLTEYFSRGGKLKHLLKSACKTCMMNLRKEWAENNRENARELNRKSWINAERRFKRHGITKEIFIKKVEEQKGKCAICLEEDELVIDHNHDTGEFRGALCRNCNRALGLLFDSKTNLQRAIDYLEKNGSYGE